MQRKRITRYKPHGIGMRYMDFLFERSSNTSLMHKNTKTDRNMTNTSLIHKNTKTNRNMTNY